MQHRSLTVAIAALAVGGLFACSTEPPGLGTGAVAHADDAQVAGEGVTVEAVGTIEGTPDVLTALVGVEVDGDDVQDTYETGNRAAADVRDALVDAGVEPDDLQTAQLSLRPDHRGGPQEAPDGYVARTQLRVDLRELDTAGAVIDEAVAAADGYATLASLGFGLDDDGDLIVAAREAAFDEARGKAEQFAELADHSLGDLVGLAESSDAHAPPPVPVPDAPVDMEVDDAGAAVEPGTEEVQVRIRATWSLE